MDKETKQAPGTLRFFITLMYESQQDMTMFSGYSLSIDQFNLIFPGFIVADCQTCRGDVALVGLRVFFTVQMVASDSGSQLITDCQLMPQSHPGPQSSCRKGTQGALKETVCPHFMGYWGASLYRCSYYHGQ